MSESFQDWFARQLKGEGEPDVTAENDAESRGRRSMHKAQAVVNNLNNPHFTEAIDGYIGDWAKMYRGDDRTQPSGGAGEILVRICCLTGAELGDVINPDNNPAEVIRKAYTTQQSQKKS